MSAIESVSPRDLRTRGRDIFDAVENGNSFHLTRDGQPIGKIIPFRRKQVFVNRNELLDMFSFGPSVDPDKFREDTDEYIDPYVDDPFERAYR